MIFNTVIAGAGGPTLYSIDNGSPSVMSVDKSSAAAGETVTVTNLTSSALSWTLNGVSQTAIAANGTATFTMPAGDVAVAEYVETYSITYNQPDVSGPSTAHEGETVTVTATNSYGDLYVRDKNALYDYDLVHFSNNTATFTMPSHDVVLDAYAGGAGS